MGAADVLSFLWSRFFLLITFFIDLFFYWSLVDVPGIFMHGSGFCLCPIPEQAPLPLHEWLMAWVAVSSHHLVHATRRHLIYFWRRVKGILTSSLMLKGGPSLFRFLQLVTPVHHAGWGLGQPIQSWAPHELSGPTSLMGTHGAARDTCLRFLWNHFL